ncbi:MAG: hypothetical protein RIA65_10070 [Woeseia sp.]
MAINLGKPTAAIVIHCLIRGVFIGAGAGVLVAAVATAYDWYLNPSELFHDSAGSHWDVIFDTTVSWFLPVTLVVAIIAVIALLLFRPK